MEKKRLTKYLWYGSDVDPEGKPIVPEVSADDDHLSGINEGEVYIHNHPDKPAIYIRTTDGKVVPIGADNLEDLEKIFLRKDKDDRSVGTISSDKGFEVGKFQEGVLGTGAAMYQNAEKATFVETDFLKVRKKAFFTNITVQELKHVGGVVILSPAAMICSKVEETTTGWKCYFNTKDADGRRVYNDFEVGDQARCQTFNLEQQTDGMVGNRYYWRLVKEWGEDFIVLSKTDYDKSVLNDIPQEGDNICQLGNRNDSLRQNAIIISAYGTDAPSFKQYKGIKSYNMAEAELVTKLSPFGNELKGVLNIEKGSSGWNNIEGLPDSIQIAVDLANKAQETIDGTGVGAVNLLLNSGFTGDYQSEDMVSGDVLTDSSELFSRKMDKWEGSVSVYADSNAVSGYSVQLGAISQSVKELVAKEKYVVSFKARGSVVSVSCGDFNVKQTLTSGFTKYSFKFEFGGSKIFSIEGNARICDLQLERGTIATDWNPSPYDNDKSFAEFQSLKYLQDAIVNGNTSVIGGLILSSMLKLGNYKDGKMQKVNAGVSGIYNDENDVAFWAGGSFENAIKTVMKFKSNPMYKPTEAEWLSLANFAVSHGGDVFLRGYVYALGGFFRGAVEIAEGKIMLNEDGSGVLANKTIWWTPEGIMYRRSPDIIHWVQLSEFSSRTITYDKGTYIDISMPMSLDDVFYLSEPPVNHFSICISFRDTLNRRMVPAVLDGNFSVYDQTTHKSMRVSKLTLSTSVCVSGSEVKMTCEKDDSGSYVWTIPEAEIHVNESTDIAYVGSINKVTAEEGKIPKLESEDFQTRKIDSLSYYIDGTRGTSETISIKAEDGTHQMTFTGGMLTGYSFKEKEDET